MALNIGGKPRPPRFANLRWEIAVALTIKVVLLTGLWFLIFRWTGDHTGRPPEITDHFAPSALQHPSEIPGGSMNTVDNKEARNDR